ncbi:MAG: prefoldin subunit beta [Candidatus Diapherotrites archaeon]
MEPKQQDIMEFERNRNNLISISSQKQQLQFQASALKNALDELEKTSEKKVYKAVGNILIQATVTDVKKELKETKESTDLRIKTLQKQEDSLVSKLNKLRREIEGKPAFSAGDAAEVSETEKSEKKEKKK